LLVEKDLALHAGLYRKKSARQLLHENRKVDTHVDGPTILTEARNDKLHLAFDGSTHIGQDGADILQLRIVCPR